MTIHAPISQADDNRPYSVAQLAARWDCSDSMVRKLIAQGRLQTFRIGVLIRISAAEVERYEKCPTETPHIPFKGSGEGSPLSGRKTPTSPLQHPAIEGEGSFTPQIGRAPKRKLASSGPAPTVHRGPWAVS